MDRPGGTGVDDSLVRHTFSSKTLTFFEMEVCTVVSVYENTVKYSSNGGKITVIFLKLSRKKFTIKIFGSTI